jgi:outer membrane receptor protein involved in Fe transport
VLPIPVRNWTISDYIAISPTIQNEIRFGYNHYPVSRHTESVNPEDNDPAHDNFPTLIKERRALRAPGISFNTFDLTQLDTPTQTFLDNFSWIRGTHTFKAGGEVRRSNGNRLQYGQGAWENYNSLNDLVIDKIFSLELDFGNPGKGFKFWTYAGYFQDDWKVNRRLQLNLGVRYEYYSVLSGPIGFKNRDPFGPFTNLGDPLWEPDAATLAARRSDV